MLHTCKFRFNLVLPCLVFISSLWFLQITWTTSLLIPKNTRTLRVNLHALCFVLCADTRVHTCCIGAWLLCQSQWDGSKFQHSLFFFLCLCCSCLGDCVRGSRPGQRQSETGGESLSQDTPREFTFRLCSPCWVWHIHSSPLQLLRLYSAWQWKNNFQAWQD